MTSRSRVRSDADIIFYNQPTSSDGAVRYLGNTIVEDHFEARVAVDLEILVDDVHAVALAASVDTGTFGDLSGLHLVLRDNAAEDVLRFEIAEASTETALLFGELYRRDESWRFRAIGQGWDSGLAGLASDFGISVADLPDDDEQPQVRGSEAEPVLAATVIEPSETTAAAAGGSPGEVGGTLEIIELERVAQAGSDEDLVGLVEKRSRSARQ